MTAHALAVDTNPFFRKRPGYEASIKESRSTHNDSVSLRTV